MQFSNLAGSNEHTNEFDCAIKRPDLGKGGDRRGWSLMGAETVGEFVGGRDGSSGPPVAGGSKRRIARSQNRSESRRPRAQSLHASDETEKVHARQTL